MILITQFVTWWTDASLPHVELELSRMIDDAWRNKVAAEGR
jgi:hypothetical protein